MGLGEVLGSNPNGEKNKRKKALTYKKKDYIDILHACMSASNMSSAPVLEGMV